MKKKKQKQKPKSKTVSFRLNLAEKQLVKNLAEKQGISESKFLENIVKPYFKEHTNKLAKTNETEPKVSLHSISLDETDNESIENNNNIHLSLINPTNRDLRLKIQLIPHKNWGKNIRKYRPKLWKTIREEQLKIFNYKCSVCGDTRRELHCHEDWHIDHEHLLQRLKGLKIVCEYCHHCIHWGMMTKIDKDGKLIEKITEHFLMINNCDKQTLSKHLEEEMNLFKKNINNNYALSLGKYALGLADLARTL